MGDKYARQPRPHTGTRSYNWHGRHMYMPLLEDMFRENMLDLIYIQDDIIFSHGVSDFWMRNIAGFSDPRDITLRILRSSMLARL